MASLFLVLCKALFILALGHISVVAQTDEVKLDAAQAKITTVSAMRVRRAPQVAAEEILRLKLGTVVNAIARSTNQDTVAGKTDYWYRVNLPNGETGWLFGGLLLDYNAQRRLEFLRQIIKYLNLHPNGAYAAEALKGLTEVLTDEVIKVANDKGGDKYVVEQRTDLRRMLASLRTAVAKTSAAEKTGLLKRLERVK